MNSAISPPNDRRDWADWPRCPECGRRRQLSCPCCQTSGSDFSQADEQLAAAPLLRVPHAGSTRSPTEPTTIGERLLTLPLTDRHVLASIDDEEDEQRRAPHAHITEEGSNAAGPQPNREHLANQPAPVGRSRNLRACREHPAAAESRSSDSLELAERSDATDLLLLCPTCDEAFAPRFYRRCQVCGHDFGSGLDVETPALASLPTQATYVVLGLLAAGIVVLAYLWVLLRS